MFDFDYTSFWSEILDSKDDELAARASVSNYCRCARVARSGETSGRALLPVIKKLFLESIFSTV